MDMMQRAAAILANPHNIGAARLSNHEFTAAIFEREGRQARLGTDCPYNPGTMAAARWQAGQAFKYGQGQFARGFQCPDDPAAAEGWQSERAYYLAAIERGARA